MQIDKSHAILAGLVTLFATHDILTQIHTKKITNLFLEADQAHNTEKAIQQAKIIYLCHKCEEHNVPVDEFDMIALNFHLDN